MQRNNVKDIIGIAMIVAGIIILALSLFLFIIHNKRIKDEKEKIAQQKAVFLQQNADASDELIDVDENSNSVNVITSSEDDIELIEIVEETPNELLPPFNEENSDTDGEIPQEDKEITEGYINFSAPKSSVEEEESDLEVNEAVIESDKPSDNATADTNKTSTKKPNILDTAVAYIDIEKIEVSAPIFPNTGKYQLRAGVGVVDTTDMPSANLNRCCAVAGHRGGRNAELNFFRADELDIGDTATVYITGYELMYTVVNKIVVEDDDWSQFYREAGKNKLILMTCHPYPVNNDRLLVICEMTNKKEL